MVVKNDLDNLSYDARHTFETAARKLGKKCGGLFHGFIQWIIDGCQEHGIRKLFFLSREGEFFAELLSHMRLEKEYLPEYRILYVSRISTYLPSLQDMGREDWERYLNQYGDQSVSAFVSSLGVPYEQTVALFKRCGLQEDVSIREQLPTFYEAVSSEEVKVFLRTESAKARELLMAYLAQEGLDNTQGTVAVVDIGWRGTIQDNLCRLLPEKTIWGYYFGLIPMLNRQPENAIKRGFVNEMPFEAALLKSHTQLEMVCSSWRGSVLGYESKNGRIIPVREDNKQDIQGWNCFTRYFQEGVISSSPKKRHILALLFLTLFPDKGVAQAFFSFQYSEKFGLGKNIDMSSIKFDRQIFQKALRGKNYLHALRLYLNSTMWPQGFLRIHGLSFLIPAYNIALLLETRKTIRVKQ